MRRARSAPYVLGCRCRDSSLFILSQTQGLAAPAPPLHPCQTSAGIHAGGSPPEDTGHVSWTVLLCARESAKAKLTRLQKLTDQDGFGVFRRGAAATDGSRMFAWIRSGWGGWGGEPLHLA